MANQNTENQTTFAEQQPFYESVQQLPTKPGQTVTPEKPWFTKKLVLISGGVTGVLVLIVFLAMVVSTLRKPAEEVSIPVDEKTTQVPETELGRRVTQLDQELQAADPSKQDLIFPPVDMEIRLDPKERN